MMSSDHEKLKAYKQGYEAWNRDDISDKDALCPYPINSSKIGLRTCWFNGLLDHRFAKYDHIPETYTSNSKVPPKCRR